MTRAFSYGFFLNFKKIFFLSIYPFLKSYRYRHCVDLTLLKECEKMSSKPLNINVSGKAKHILKTLHERECKSYSDIIIQLYKNSPDPIDIINNSISELKLKIGNEKLDENIERIRIMILKCYNNQKEYEKINSILEKAMNEIRTLKPEIEGDVQQSPIFITKKTKE